MDPVMDFYKSHEGSVSDVDAAKGIGKSRIHAPTTEKSRSRRLHV